MSDFREQLQKNLGAAYVLTSELGGGGMARVFLAEETSLGRRVVVKVLDPELAPGLSAERFAREVKLLAALQHPNIVPIISAGVAGGFPYYTMPFVDGMSLKELLDEKGRLEISTALVLLRDVARALAYAHESGVVHRDIKPGNVLVSHGAAVVADFGIAKAVRVAESSKDPTLTATGTSLGTPAYMAPEQAAGDPSTDHRTDIYAWGVVGYELLTGHIPFHDRPPHELLVAQMTETPASVTVSRKDAPAGLAALIARCLKKNAADRPQSANEILALLEEVRSSSFLGYWKSKPRALAAGLLGLAVIGTAAGAIGWRSHRLVGSDVTTPMLAVLPFDNRGASSDAYFADGITDELTSQIGRLPGLGVVSRLSAKKAAATGKSLKEIAQTLGVAYVLEGTVRWDRSSGGVGRVRVTPELVRVIDGRELWTQSYDDNATAVFAVQDSIARHVSDAIATKLSASPATLGSAPPTKNFDAYTAYLQGQYELDNSSFGFDTTRTQHAVELFRRAIKLDSTFALAYYGLHWALFGTPGATSEDSAIREGREALLTAARLGPKVPLIQIQLARMMTDSGDFAPGYALLKNVIAKEPNNAAAHMAMANALGWDEGKCAEAMPYLRRAMQLDPTNYDPPATAAQCTAVLREYTLTRHYLDRAAALMPSDPVVPWTRVAIVATLGGRRDSARVMLGDLIARFGIATVARLEIYDELRLTQSLISESGARAILATPTPSEPQTQALERHGKLLIALAVGDRTTIRAYAESAKVSISKAIWLSPNDFRHHYQMATAAAVLGDRTTAFSELERASKLHIIGNYTPVFMQWYFDVDKASVYTILGERELATKTLSKLLSGPSYMSVPELRTNPTWAPLRGYPPFDALLERRN